MKIFLMERKQCLKLFFTKSQNLRATQLAILILICKVFILSTAVRILRGQVNEHSTMLIHVSLNVDVQNKVKQQVEDEFYAVRDRINFGDGDGESVIELFHVVWQEIFVARADSFEGYDLPDWENVKEKIREVISLIQTKEINGFPCQNFPY